MIPLAQITQWRQSAPWPDNNQIEQDLILSRVIVDIFSDPFLVKELAFRGGTALHKLFFTPPARYSEDIDLVRSSNGKITEIIDALRSRLDPWLGEPKTKRNQFLFKLYYFFNPETSPNTKMRIKIEINTRETLPAFDYYLKDFSVNSVWYSGQTKIKTFLLEELLATKLRALYQRKKGRDLFDLWLALKSTSLDIKKLISAFHHYSEPGNLITRPMFENNLERKLQEPSFIDDIDPLLSPELKKKQSRILVTENDLLITTENGKKLSTEGWHLFDAANEVKSKILIHFPD